MYYLSESNIIFSKFAIKNRVSSPFGDQLSVTSPHSTWSCRQDRNTQDRTG